MATTHDALPPLAFPTLGLEVIAWAEHFLGHGPGDVQGEPIELDDELAAFLCHAYRLTDAARRAFRRAVLSRPKGRSKSELAGIVVCVEAIGPARFDHWAEEGEVAAWSDPASPYVFEAGDPVGRPVRAPFIRCLATEEGQSGNTYDNVRVMLSADRVREAYPGLDVGLTRVFTPDGGEVVPSTASSAAKDGGKETFRVADETHLYVLPELRRMVETVDRNLAKRKAAEPWALDTTTAFAPGEDSIAERLHEHARKLGSYDARLARGLLHDHREAPPIAAWTNDAQLRAALAQVYGPAATWMDLDRIVAEIRDPQNDEADSRRYWLNQVVASSGGWLDPRTFHDRRNVGRVLEADETITLGFDGSRFHDATGLVATTEDGWQDVLGVWEKPAGPDGEGWEVPAAEVHAAVADAFERYRVVRFYADPPYWNSEVDQWSGEHGDVVYAWHTNRETPMARAVGAYATAVRSGALSHSGHPRLERHVANAHRRKVRARLADDAEDAYVIAKDRARSPRKIDLAVAAVLSWEARSDAIAAAEFRRARRRRSRVPLSL